MKTEFVRTKTSDNLVLAGAFTEPSSPTTRAVLFVHGRGGNFFRDQFIDNLREVTVSNNLAFLTVNTRGHDIISYIPPANSSEKDKKAGSAFEIFDECQYDVAAWIDFLEKKQFKEIILVGHSLGASKVAYYMAKSNDKRVSHIVFLSPVPIVIMKGDPHFKTLFAEAQQMLKDKKTNELLSHKVLRNYMSAQTLLHYVSNTDVQNIFNVFDPTQTSLLSKLHLPVLVVYGENDQYKEYYSIPGLITYIIDKAIDCEVSSNIIKNGDHGFAPEESTMADIVIKWILS